MLPTDRYRRGRPASPPSPASDGNSGRYPVNGGHSRYPDDGHSRKYPAEGHNNEYPALGRNAADGRSGRFPADNHHGGYSGEGRRGKYPTDIHSGEYPAGGLNAADGRSGRFPADNHYGGYSGEGRRGKHPDDGRAGGKYPTDIHSGEYPASARNAADGRYPAGGRDGGHSADGRGGRYPADGITGGYHAVDGGAGGFSFLRDPVAPASADPRLWSCFIAVDTDRSGSISVHELQGALVNGDSTPFDPETVKLLISLFDGNQTGGIDFNEFTRLSQYIEEWRRMFQHFDQDYSGTIDSSELQSALNQFGMKLPPHLVSLLVAKFASSPGSQADEQTITFDRFIRACVFMKKFKRSFANLDRDKDGRVQLSYQQCLKLYLMLP